MLSDYIDIDFFAIRDKLGEVIFNTASAVAGFTDQVLDAAEDAFYGNDEDAVAVDIETVDLTKPFEVQAGIEPWLRKSN